MVRSTANPSVLQTSAYSPCFFCRLISNFQGRSGHFRGVYTTDQFKQAPKARDARRVLGHAPSPLPPRRSMRPWFSQLRLTRYLYGYACQFKSHSRNTIRQTNDNINYLSQSSQELLTGFPMIPGVPCSPTGPGNPCKFHNKYILWTYKFPFT